MRCAQLDEAKCAHYGPNCYSDKANSWHHLQYIGHDKHIHCVSITGNGKLQLLFNQYKEYQYSTICPHAATESWKAEVPENAHLLSNSVGLCQHIWVLLLPTWKGVHPSHWCTKHRVLSPCGHVLECHSFYSEGRNWRVWKKKTVHWGSSFARMLLVWGWIAKVSEV